jgi:DMSO/TMAO reductase YedYZ molybdopterin-dependent catalytic subunit
MNRMNDDTKQNLGRRRFLGQAAYGTTILVLGGGYMVSEALTNEAQAATREDGRPRLPPGQRVLEKLKPMGGDAGDPRASAFRLAIGGSVERPFSLGFAELLQQNPVTLALDVHCVTGWSVLGARFKGVRLKDLAARAGVKPSAKHVVFEAAHGYTSNVLLRHALDPNTLITWELDGQRLAGPHGGPARVVVPDLYFWKSAKWITGVRFVDRDEAGYWETRGYHNHADPWREERYG